MKQILYTLVIFSLATTFVACGGGSHSGSSKDSSAQACTVNCDQLGNEQGNGADYLFVGAGSAWFLGPRAIRYCVATSPDFGVGQARAEQAVADAFSRWATYAAKKLRATGSPGVHSISFQSQKISSCDGTQDLAFYLGERAPELGPYWNGLKNRVGASVRVSYDLIRGWSHGFVWLAPSGSIKTDRPAAENYPDWQLGSNLDAILTHELGHVFGNEHVLDTVMRSDIANMLRGNMDEENQMGPLSPSVDQYVELLICDECHMDFQGGIGLYVVETSQGGKESHVTLDTISQSFEILTGEKLVGDPLAVTAHFSGDYQNGFQLDINGNGKSYKFPLRFDLDNRSEIDSSVNVFKVVFGLPDGGFEIDLPRSGGYTVPGTLVTSTGETMNVTMNRNMVVKTPFEKDSQGYSHREVLGDAFSITFLHDGKNLAAFVTSTAELNK